MSGLKPNARFEAELLDLADHRFGLLEQIPAEMPELQAGLEAFSGKLQDVRAE